MGAQRGKAGQVLRGHGDKVKRQAKAQKHVKPQLWRDEGQAGGGQRQ